MAAELSRQQADFIVRRLAMFEPPNAIINAFLALFPDTKIDANDVHRLNPAIGALLPPDLFKLFKTTREEVLLDPSSAPFADQKARLIALSNDVRFYRDNNQIPLASSTLRQIAEELGVIGAGARKPKNDDPADETAELIGAITRTIVDPAKKDENVKE